MERWESGPRMIQRPELEEGEACYHKNDKNMDPDFDLSYIGDKVQSLLGHLQKEFEGGVSAENLGAIYGGYGSFLPMHQRLPSVCSQIKSSRKLQNPSIPKSPNNPLPENHVPLSTMVSDSNYMQRNGSSSPHNFFQSKNLNTLFEDCSIIKTAVTSSDKVFEASPGKGEVPPCNSHNPSEQRTLKVRLKLGSDRMEQYNAEIHSLGLTSPSSSSGNSPEDSGKLKFESGESPERILQIMTSFLVSGCSLLSPLGEEFLNFDKEREILVEHEHDNAPKGSAISIRIGNKGVPRGKKPKSADKSEDPKKTENECVPDFGDFKQKSSGSETLGCRIQPLDDLTSRPSSDIVCSTSESMKDAVVLPGPARNSEKDVPLKKRKGNKDRLKGRTKSCNLVEDALLGCAKTKSYGKYDLQGSRSSDGQKVAEHRTSSSQKDISVHHGQVNSSRINQHCASVKSCPDISEGERAKVAMDKLSLKVGLKAKSSELDNFGLNIDVNNISSNKKSKLSQSSDELTSHSSNVLRDGVRATPKDKDSGKKAGHRVHHSQKNVIDISGEHMGNLKRSLTKASGDSSKNSILNITKERKESADKFERENNKSLMDKMTSDIYVTEPPAETIPLNDGAITGKVETPVGPVLIQEEWVACDRCEKWRLLPYGTKSNQLPDKWVCNMLDWLPGMNSCEISEDDTTSAVRALLFIPAPEYHNNIQPHADRSFSRLSSAGAFPSTPNHLNFASDPMAYQSKSQKFKRRSDTLGMNYPLSSYDVSDKLQCQSVKNRNLKEMNQPPSGVKATNTLQCANESKVSVSKSNKRKDEHMIGDGGNPRKKINKEPLQNLLGSAKKVKSKGDLNVDSFQVSGANLDRISQNLKSGLLSKEAGKEKKKLNKQDKITLDRDCFQNYVEKQKEQIPDLPDKDPLNKKAYNRIEVSAKKRKFKDRENQIETLQNNLSNFRETEVFMNRKGKNEALQKSKDDDSSKNKKVSETRVVSSRSNENSTKRSIEKKWQLNNLKVKLSLTKGDIDELRKDLGYEQFSTAATSSSSKISDSRKNIVAFMGDKGSPEESVSSSPMRMSYVDQVVPLTMDTSVKVGSRANDFSTVSSAKRSLKENGSSEWGITRKGKATDSRRPESIDNTAFEFQESIAKEIYSGEHASHINLSSDFKNNLLADNEGSVLEHGHVSSSMPVNCGHRKEGMSKDHFINLLPQQNPRKNSARNSVCTNRANGNAVGLEILDSKEKMKGETDANDDYSVAQYEVLSNVKRPFSDDSCVKSVQNNSKSVALEESFVNENVSDHAASTALKEAQDVLKKAEELKNHAYLIKSVGFGSESNDEYFKAALMFLHGASLFESCHSGSMQNLEINLMQVYGTAAKLSESCSIEYEKSSELAATALAYKCVEVAYLRMVYCKSSSANKLCRDLLTNLQMAPHGESPSSSASDIDNLNNLVVNDQTIFPKVNDSHSLNHVMLPRNHTSYVRLLDFTKDVNSAMDAAKKSQAAFAAAQVKLEESKNKKAIFAVKRVIDFSFHDVEELINSVRLAFDAINRQAPAPSSTKEH